MPRTARASPGEYRDRRSIRPGPAPRGDDWFDEVNAVMTEAECASIRESIGRDRPVGTERGVRETADMLGLRSSLRNRGRPRRRATATREISRTRLGPDHGKIDECDL